MNTTLRNGSRIARATILAVLLLFIAVGSVFAQVCSIGEHLACAAACEEMRESVPSQARHDSAPLAQPFHPLPECPVSSAAAASVGQQSRAPVEAAAHRIVPIPILFLRLAL